MTKFTGDEEKNITALSEDLDKRLENLKNVEASKISYWIIK